NLFGGQNPVRRPILHFGGLRRPSRFCAALEQLNIVGHNLKRASAVRDPDSHPVGRLRAPTFLSLMFLLSGIPTVENKNHPSWTDVRHDSCRLYASEDGMENKKHARWRRPN